MASAGVVGAADVFTPSSAPARSGITGTPAMWAFVWVGVAALILVFLHLAMVGRGAR